MKRLNKKQLKLYQERYEELVDESLEATVRVSGKIVIDIIDEAEKELLDEFNEIYDKLLDEYNERKISIRTTLLNELNEFEIIKSEEDSDIVL